jgi:hypothetical protein
VVGVDPAAYDTATVANPNPSLSLIEADIMRRVSAALPDNLSHDQKAQTRIIFANRLLRGSARGPSAALPPESRDWVTERAMRMVQELSSLGVRVAGDMSDLIPRMAPIEHQPDASATLDHAAAVSAVAVRAAASIMLELVEPSAQAAKRRQRRNARAQTTGNPDLPATKEAVAARRARRRERRAARARKT